MSEDPLNDVFLEDPLHASFLKLFKFYDAMRLKGTKAIGKKNIDFLGTLTYRQEHSLFVIGQGENTTPNGIHLKDLAHELESTLPATSVLVEIMVKKDLISRHRSTEDRRRLCLRLTPFGRMTLRLVQDGIDRLSAYLMKDVPKQDQEAFIRVINHFSEMIDDDRGD